MKKILLKNGLLLGLLANALTLLPKGADAQVEWRNFRSAAWNNTSTGNSTGTWQSYNATTQTWTNNQPGPATTDNATLRDAIFMTSGGNYTINNLSVGEGGGALATATINSGSVSSITVSDPGSMIAIPTVNFFGASTGIATATVSSLSVTGVAVNSVGGTIAGGTAYDNTTLVTIGTPWAANTAYSVGAQRSANGNLYTVVTAGTSDANGTGPTGTGTGITDGTVVWNYAGKAATATPVISGGSVTGITITEPGSGYTAIPTITITGPGTGASYAAKIGIDKITITNGGSGYQTAPDVMMGANWQVGNSTTTRTFTTTGNIDFKKGAYYYHPGTAGQNLVVGGNLTAATPITFRIRSGTISNATNVTFNNATTTNHTTSGAQMTFQDLTISAGQTLNMTNNIVVYGTLLNNGTLNINGNATFLGTVTNNGTINGTYSTVLPVKISKLTAKAQPNGIIIQWITSSEQNSDKFIIEKSLDDKSFSTLSEVKSKGASSYSVYDNAPAAGTNYYRLSQVDLDGKVSDKGVVSAKFGVSATALSVVAYPIPSSGDLKVNASNASSSSAQFAIYSIAGNIVKRGTIQTGSAATIDISALAPGKYILKIVSGIESQTTSIVKL